jgi:hypothetical protein
MKVENGALKGEINKVSEGQSKVFSLKRFFEKCMMSWYDK